MSRNDIGYNSDAVVRELLLELALPANNQLTRKRAGKSATALIEGPTAKAVEAAARVLHDVAIRHGWWGKYKKSYDELAATDPIGKYESSMTKGPPDMSALGQQRASRRRLTRSALSPKPDITAFELVGRKGPLQDIARWV